MDEIQKNIVEWIQYDTKIKDEAQKMKGYKEKRDLIGDSLMPLLEGNDLQEHTFNIPQYKKSFGCSESSSTEGMSYKFLETCFNEFFDSPDKSKELIQYIKDNRKKTTKRVFKCTDLE